MDLIWDPEKRQTNLAKHGLDFIDAQAVFQGAVFTFEDKRRSYGEQRLLALGMLEDVVVAIAFTEPAEDLIRLISMRRATRHEQRIYFKKLPDGLGSSPFHEG